VVQERARLDVVQFKMGMTTVHIAEPEICLQAMEWCVSQFPSKSWKVNHRWPHVGYDFYFKDPLAATLFGLKWAGSV